MARAADGAALGAILFDQGFQALIQTTARTVAIEIFQMQQGWMRDVVDEFKRIHETLGRPDLVINLKKEKDGNG
jgi:hypothetical protein